MSKHLVQTKKSKVLQNVTVKLPELVKRSLVEVRLDGVVHETIDNIRMENGKVYFDYAVAVSKSMPETVKTISWTYFSGKGVPDRVVTATVSDPLNGLVKDSIGVASRENDQFLRVAYSVLVTNVKIHSWKDQTSE